MDPTVVDMTSCDPMSIRFRPGDPYTIRMVDDGQLWRRAVGLVADPAFAAHFYISVEKRNGVGKKCEFTLGLVYTKDKKASILRYMGTDLYGPDKIISVCSKRERDCLDGKKPCRRCRELESMYRDREGNMTVRGRPVPQIPPGTLNRTQADILNWMVEKTREGNFKRAQAVTPTREQAKKGISTYFHVKLPFYYSLTPDLCGRRKGADLNTYANCQKLAQLFADDPEPLARALKVEMVHKRGRG